jgi:hypothetical protein
MKALSRRPSVDAHVRLASQPPTRRRLRTYTATSFPHPRRPGVAPSTLAHCRHLIASRQMCINASEVTLGRGVRGGAQAIGATHALSDYRWYAPDFKLEVSIQRRDCAVKVA